jgi:hypothetical protein
MGKLTSLKEWVGAGVLFDLIVEFAAVGGGTGAVATGFGLGFLVSASIGVIDKGGCVIIVILGKMLGFIKGCPLDDFGIVDIIIICCI